jgi:hypothetical protein
MCARCARSALPATSSAGQLPCTCDGYVPAGGLRGDPEKDFTGGYRFRPAVTHFDGFPRLTRAAILDVTSRDLPALLAPLAISDSVTDVGLQLWCEPGSHTLPPLPNLRALSVDGLRLDVALAFPDTLRELDLLQPEVASFHMDAMTRLPKLTRLAILGPVYTDWSVAEPLDALTALTRLQRLQIVCTSRHITSLGILSRLTHLDWMPASHDTEVADLGPFTRLQRLVHLGIGPMRLPVEQDRLTCINVGAINSLQSLNVNDLRRPLAAGDAAMLTQVSHLTRLALGCDTFLHCLERTPLQGLQELVLQDVFGLRGEGVAILQRAKRLTAFQFGYSEDVGKRPASELCRAISRMPRLEKLVLKVGPRLSGSLFESIRQITCLTLLDWEGPYVTRADVTACLRLKKLRTLTLVPERPAPRGPIDFWSFVALAQLPELRKLRLGYHMGFLEDWPVEHWNAIDPLFNGERYARGWPALDLERLSGRVEDLSDPLAWRHFIWDGVY